MFATTFFSFYGAQTQSSDVSSFSCTNISCNGLGPHSYDLLKDPVSKHSQIGGLGYNIWIWGDTIQSIALLLRPVSEPNRNKQCSKWRLVHLVQLLFWSMVNNKIIVMTFAMQSSQPLSPVCIFHHPHESLLCVMSVWGMVVQ